MYYKRYNEIVEKIEEDTDFEQSIMELVCKESTYRESPMKKSSGRECESPISSLSHN